MLDEISTDVPIWVIAYAPHVIHTNTPMINQIGVDEDTRLHGLVRFPDGSLNGWFLNTAATLVAYGLARD